MKRVLTAVVLIPIVLLVVFKAPLWVFTVVCAVFALAAANEYLEIIKGYGVEPIRFPTLVTISLLFLLTLILLLVRARYWVSGNENLLLFLWSSNLLGWLQLFGSLVVLASAMRSADLAKALPSAAMSALAIPYIGSSLLLLISIRFRHDGLFLILLLFVVVWSGDIFAYYIGKTFGRHKLAPKISPNKTWEGAIASVCGSVLLGWLLFLWQGAIVNLVGEGVPFTPTNGSIAGFVLFLILLNIAAQLGDLAESMLKRGAGVKDSGFLIPGHGGVLDRIDALLFAIPVVSIYAMMSVTTY